MYGIEFGQGLVGGGVSMFRNDDDVGPGAKTSTF